jgi:hypothetical protein
MLLTAAKRSNYSSFCRGNCPSCLALRLNFCDDCYLANKKPPGDASGGLMLEVCLMCFGVGSDRSFWARVKARIAAVQLGGAIDGA